MIDSSSRRAVLQGLGGAGLLSLLSGCSNRSDDAPTEPYRERAEKLRAQLEELASYAQTSVPGFQIACILDGQVAWSEGLGIRNDAGDPVTADTVFDLGSLTKPLFGTAVLRLVERGLFDLDRPLSEYGPPLNASETERSTRVTARHVLTHQTGLPNWRPFEPGSDLSFLSDPMAGFSYSGEGFFWLQQVIEDVTGTSLPRFVETEVLRPVGMVRSSFLFEERFADDYAQGFRRIGDPSVDSWNKRNAEYVREQIQGQQGSLDALTTQEAWPLARRDQDPDAALPSPVLLPANAAGSLQGTAADYARLLTVYMEGGAASATLQQQTVTKALSKETFINDYIDYGLGWRLETTKRGRSFWHSGYNQGFHSFALADPEGRYGLVLLTNSDRGNRLRWPVIYEGTGHGEAAIVS